MRYSRQELIIGKDGQEIIGKKTVGIVGLGAIGSVSAQILARAGIKKLILIDRDVVELSNLQRQLLYKEEDVGFPKAITAKKALKKINSEIIISSFAEDLNPKNIDLLKKADIILDCTDNLETRFLINDFCIKFSKLWIYAAGIATRGTILSFSKDSPCFRCIFENSKSNDTCETTGVLASTTMIVGSVQAKIALDILLNKKVPSEMIWLDVETFNLQKIKVKKRNGCPACNKNFEYLKGEKGSKTTKVCGKSTYQIRGEKKNLNELKKRLERIDKVRGNSDFLIFRNISIFKDGRVLIKADSEKEAKSIYSKYVGN